MRFDVAIVGAGPAGCAAAIELSRAGRSVIVLEKRVFPRHKVCGGCLSGFAVAQLGRVLGTVKLPGARATDIIFHIGGQENRCSPQGLSRVVLRAEFDSLLAEAAKRCGADLRFDHSATIMPAGSGFKVVADQEIEANHILLACGLNFAVHQCGIETIPFGGPMIGRQWLIPASRSGLRPGTVEMYWLDGGYIGLAAPGSGDCIVAVAMEAGGIAGQASLARLQSRNPVAPIWKRIDCCNGAMGGVAGFPFVPKRLTQSNVMLVGDAAGFSEPFSGTGIGLALFSGRCAARAIIQGGDVAYTYTQRMRSHRRSLWRTRALGAALRSGITRRVFERVWDRTAQGLVSAVVRHVHVRGGI